MKKALWFLLIFAGMCVFCNAQQVVPSGGYEVKSGITVDWILGGSLTGFTAYDISTSLEEQNALPDGAGYTIKVYPTLTKDFTTIEISPFGTSRYLLELFSNSGVRVLDRIMMDKPVVQVNLSSLPAGIYYLRIFISGEDQPLKFEKVVKI